MYVERPVAVSHEQIKALCSAYGTCAKTLSQNTSGVSPEQAATFVRVYLRRKGPLILGYLVSSHRLPLDRWYRCPEKGMRLWQ